MDEIYSDIIIDDRLSNLRGNARLKILFPAYHNKEIIANKKKNEDGIICVDGWKDIEKILL